MAAAQLNFVEGNLDTTSALYSLYTKLYNGMVAAGQVDAPDYVTNPPLKADGSVDQAAITTGLNNYTTILMKNSAYLFAQSITDVLNGSSSGSGGSGSGNLSGYLQRSGDSMVGQLLANYGFQAGKDNVVIFQVARANNVSSATITGTLSVSSDVTISGKLTLDAAKGLYFGNSQIFYTDSEDGKIHLNSSNVVIDGAIEVEELTIGDVTINENGLFNDEDEYYYPGNCNKADVDWEMDDAIVHGDLTVTGAVSYSGAFSALKGFSLGANNIKILYSYYDSESDARPIVKLDGDIDIASSYGLKLQGQYIIKVRSGSSNVISIATPGKIMNLGDSVGDTATTRIDLQADMYDSSGTNKLVSKYGDGNFPNSFSAGCGNIGSTVMQSYYASASDMGMVFQKNIRLGSASGPFLKENSGAISLNNSFVYVDDNSVQHTVWYETKLKMIATTSLFHDLTITNSASCEFSTEAEFFSFAKPVAGTSFSIKSQTYKTRLTENTLFLNDGVWIEGVTGGMSWHGNAYFSGSLSSTSFSSGFAGSGWAISSDALYGGIGATFDTITVRKKMRVYELEVQKLSVTNGSLWVSDNCSGDSVSEVS